MQRLTVDAAGVRTSLIDTGRGRPTILVHGTSSSAETGWAPILARLAERRRCLVPDLAGSGLSVDDGSALTLERLVGQVEAVAALAEGEALDLVGYSLGGVVAAAAAAGLAGQVRRLVVLGGWAATDLRMRVQFDLWQALARTDRTQLARLLLLNGVSERFFAASDPSLVETVLARFATGLAPGSDRQAALDAIVDIRACLPAVRAATLVIGLAQDRLVPPAHCRALAQAVPGARYEEIDCGHLVMLEQPERLLERIERHLEERHD